jgi:hypothetical protein
VIYAIHVLAALGFFVAGVRHERARWRRSIRGVMVISAITPAIARKVRR